MSSPKGNLVDRWAPTAIALCLLYSAVCSLALTLGWGDETVA